MFENLEGWGWEQLPRQICFDEYYLKESTTIVSTFLKGQSSGRLSTALTRILIKKELDSSNI
jgi:hypothetical protein